VSDILVDLVHQFAHALERTAPDGLLGDQCEPALNLVEPACVGRGVVYVEAGMPRQPRFDPRMLVGAVVVGDQMDRKPERHIALEVIKKGAKFLVPMARLALGDDRTVEHVERREQRGRAMPIVVVGHAVDVAQPHRQHRLSTLQSLNLALLIHAPHQCLVRGIEVKARHVRTLSTKNGSVESLKLLAR